MMPFAPAVLFTLSRRLYAVIAGIVLLVLVVGGLVIFHGPNDFAGAPERQFFIKRGESFAQIVDSLEAQGIIRDRTMFRLVARVYGGTDRLQIGKYRFVSGMSNAEIYLSLREGRGNQLVKVSIPEGSRPRLQARLFARAIGIDSSRFVNLVYDPETTRDFGIEAESLEGYLLPETYSLYWGMDEKELIQMQVREFRKFFSDSLVQRAKDLGWTVHQAVTFASIVEGEAVMDAERPTIAAVYHNRLRKGMRLEADPTIQYLFDGGPRRVLYADLRMDSPYNTYKYAGLPPGPVNNPGKASMLASLYPAAHSYLYFVANGNGGHWFSQTYAEHMQNVRRYRHERARQWREAKNASGG
ncbi:MAG: putative periplasmic solute-binding protein [Bacteroidetes bacterium]|jgi:UPF0755 protein|nr:putative periplasmic solute-binding protein [Bacteroidota bacterium]